MRRSKDIVIALTTAGAVVALSGAVEAQAQEQTGPETVAPDSLFPGATIMLRVDGMSCPFCAYGLERRLQKVAAIDSVLIRVGDGLVQIRVKDGAELTDETLHEAVRRAGFSLREIRRVEDS